VALLAALALADAALSTCLLSRGLMREANPLVRSGLHHLGLTGFVSLKLTVTGGALGLLAAYRHALQCLAWRAGALHLALLVGGFVLANLDRLAALYAL